EDRYRALRQRFPEIALELDLTHRCGMQLGAVLRGEVKAVELLFGSDSSLATLYEDSLSLATMNRALAAIVSDFVTGLPVHQRVDVLEVGAGTGGASARILATLPAERSRYLFTDISPSFFEPARRRFREYGFVEYAQFDIEQGLRDPRTTSSAPSAPSSATGPAVRPGTMDVVIASNVIHATCDLQTSLQHLAAALRPGGRLFLLEATSSQLWVDLTFGLTDGWWRFTDTHVRDHALISADHWRESLTLAGFEDIEIWTPDADAEVLSRQAVISAARPRESKPVEVWLLADNNEYAAALGDHLASRSSGRVHSRSVNVRELGDEGGGAIDAANSGSLASALARGVHILECRALGGHVQPDQAGFMHLANALKGILNQVPVPGTSREVDTPGTTGANPRSVPGRYALLSDRAIQTGAGDTLANPAQALARGLFMAAAMEAP
ncbi:MAG: class I SAM-dependent methyltransferase, partial [Myxococcota bacterium]